MLPFVLLAKCPSCPTCGESEVTLERGPCYYSCCCYLKGCRPSAGGAAFLVPVPDLIAETVVSIADSAEGAFAAGSFISAMG